MPSCSPLPGEMGLGGYYGHYQGHWMSAMAFLYNTTGNETVKQVGARTYSSLNLAYACVRRVAGITTWRVGRRHW